MVIDPPASDMTMCGLAMLYLYTGCFTGIQCVVEDQTYERKSNIPLTQNHM